MSFLVDLYNKRKKLADVLADEEYSGIRSIVEELYPDQAHFIYELLQNAEDTGATEVNFFLKENILVFEHDGRPFNKKDVKRITNIGERAEEGQEKKIGRFGIGFKAVFAYSETPRVWSPTFSFEIQQLVLPVEISSRKYLDNKTRFEFPFNNPKKSPEDAFAEIAAGLEALAEVTLLFLRNIKIISWEITGRNPGEVLKINHTDHHVEVLKQADNRKTSSSHFLIFSTPIEIDGRPTQSVSIAYVLDFLPKISDFNSTMALSKQLKIVPANPGHVAVFFPAEKETSGLRFHLHAPFVPELSRASIKQTSANDLLFDMLADLAASSLHEIRDLGLLTGEFLGVLPNPVDTLPNQYEPIRQSIVTAMDNEPLTPTYSKSYAPARHLLQAKAALKELLPEKDLEFLINYDDEPPKWAIAAPQRNSDQDRFLAGLAIKKWDLEQFIRLLCKRASEKNYDWEDGPEEDFMVWLSAKSPAWHQQLYSILFRELDDYGSFYQLEDVCIARLSDESYSTGKKCYFPGDFTEHDEALPRVDSRTYLSGKKSKQRENARLFLEKIGVREVGETEEVKAILKLRYTYDADIPNKKTYFTDLRRFIKFVKQNSDLAEIFAGYYIFCRDDESWVKPSDVYLDSPYLQTGLSAYYERFSDDEHPKKLLTSYYNKQITTKKLVDFADAVGVITALPIIETDCTNNPKREYLWAVPGKRRGYYIDEDYLIEHLEELLETPTLELSKLVWRTMCSLPWHPNYLQAQYQINEANGPHHAESQLVHHLRNAAWIPQKNGDFVQPCDAAREALPKGFSFDEGMEWLQKIDFGANDVKRNEEYIHRNQQASELGVDLKDIEFMKQHPEEFEQWKASLQNKEIIVFPKRISKNSPRRQTKLADQINNAQDKEYEQRKRSVRITKGQIDPDRWLRNQYTNEADQMVCQVCKKEMPFKKRNGEYYFEAVEVLSRDHFTREHEAQFLALCPLCAAMYKEFVKHDEEAMIDLKNALMNTDDCEIPLHLGELYTSIRFVETHYHDIKTIIETSKQDEE